MNKTSSGQEAAKIIRQILKKEFPGVKFRVRSDYTSVRVYWTDGPTTRAVNKFVQGFEYGHFDGMQDMYVIDENRTKGGPDVKYVLTQRDMSKQAEEYIKENINKDYDIDIDAMTNQEFFGEFHMWPESKVRDVFSMHDFTHSNPKIDYNKSHYSSVNKPMKFKLAQDIMLGRTVVHEGDIIEVIEDKNKHASVKTSGATSLSYELDKSVNLTQWLKHQQVADKEDMYMEVEEGFSGDTQTVDYVKDQRNLSVFPDYVSARDYCLDHAEKWEYLVAVLYTEDDGEVKTLVAGWAAE